MILLYEIKTQVNDRYYDYNLQYDEKKEKYVLEIIDENIPNFPIYIWCGLLTKENILKARLKFRDYLMENEKIIEVNKY